MAAHPVTWSIRAMWLVLPFTVGAGLALALDQRSTPVELTLAVGCWIGWAIGLVAAMVPRPIALTALRLLAPAAVVVAAWATWQSDGDVLGVVGLVLTVVVAALIGTGYVADDYVDGASYGDERRFSLRTPGVLLITAVPVALVVAIAGVAAGPLLVAAEQWVVGVVVWIVGWVLAAGAARSLHSLSVRFVVFVPAGMTLVDPSTLTDAVLLTRASLVRLGPAPADSDGLDLSGQALGLALEATCSAPVGFTVRRGRGEAEEVTARRVVFTPARPTAVLAEADRRRIPVGV